MGNLEMLKQRYRQCFEESERLGRRLSEVRADKKDAEVSLNGAWTDVQWFMRRALEGNGHVFPDLYHPCERCGMLIDAHSVVFRGCDQVTVCNGAPVAQNC